MIKQSSLLRSTVLVATLCASPHLFGKTSQASGPTLNPSRSLTTAKIEPRDGRRPKRDIVLSQASPVTAPAPRTYSLSKNKKGKGKPQTTKAVELIAEIQDDRQGSSATPKVANDVTANNLTVNNNAVIQGTLFCCEIDPCRQDPICDNEKPITCFSGDVGIHPGDAKHPAHKLLTNEINPVKVCTKLVNGVLIERCVPDDTGTTAFSGHVSINAGQTLFVNNIDPLTSATDECSLTSFSGGIKIKQAHVWNQLDNVFCDTLARPVLHLVNNQTCQTPICSLVNNQINPQLQAAIVNCECPHCCLVNLTYIGVGFETDITGTHCFDILYTSSLIVCSGLTNDVVVLGESSHSICSPSCGIHATSCHVSQQTGQEAYIALELVNCPANRIFAGVCGSLYYEVICPCLATVCRPARTAVCSNG